MTKDPAILFYTSDFLAGTAYFNDEQRGQYIKLLCEQHQNGHIPKEHMIDICKSCDSPVFKKFIPDSEGLYFNERMENEILKRVKYSESRRNNRNGGNKPDTYDDTHVDTYDSSMSTHMGNGDINEINYKGVVENYHFLCPKLNRVMVINDFRKGLINARVGEYELPKVIEVLRKAGESDFLNGINDKAWKADFEWIMRPQNFVKIMEGKYKNVIKETERNLPYDKILTGNER